MFDYIFSNLFFACLDAIKKIFALMTIQFSL